MTSILVAEDDAAVRSMLQAVLVRAGYAVEGVGSGLECLEVLTAAAADLVVLDVEMPQLDGWDTLSAIRATSTVPVVLLTALSGDEHRARSVERGANAFLSKPFLNSDLLQVIRDVLGIPADAS